MGGRKGRSKKRRKRRREEEEARKQGGREGSRTKSNLSEAGQLSKTKARKSLMTAMQKQICPLWKSKLSSAENNY